jgi:hypothetical protein
MIDIRSGGMENLDQYMKLKVANSIDAAKK